MIEIFSSNKEEPVERIGPANGFFKLNVERAVSSSNQASCGGVIRNDMGQYLVTTFEFIQSLKPNFGACILVSV